MLQRKEQLILAEVEIITKSISLAQFLNILKTAPKFVAFNKASL